MEEYVIKIPEAYLKIVKETMRVIKAEEKIRYAERIPVYFTQLKPGEYQIAPDGRVAAYNILFALKLADDYKLSPGDTAILLRCYANDLCAMANLADTKADLYHTYAVWNMDNV
jgi:hypothetical protein